MIDIIDWRFTNKCDNFCMYCYAHTDCQELTYEEKIYILDNLIKEGCTNLCLTGGEPMINSHECVKFIKYAFDRGVKIHLSTNGLNYIENQAEVHNRIVRLSLPVDGFDPMSNCCNGRIYTAFDTVLGILEMSRKTDNNPYIKINSTITSNNCSIETLIKIYNILRYFPIDHWEIYEFIPENRGATNLSKLSISSDKFDQLESTFKNSINTSDFNIEFSSRKSRDSRYFIIQPDGNVIIPLDNSNTVDELIVGNLLHEEYRIIEQKWKECAIVDTTFQNKRTFQCKG